MRYYIDHVLEGMALVREKDLREARTALESEHKGLEDLHSVMLQAPVALANALADAGQKVLEQAQLTKGDFNKILGEYTGSILSELPNQYEFERLEANRDRAQKKVDSLEQAPELELFLKAVRQGGETHVSQHAIKQAGFSNENITRYVMARAKHTEVEN